MTILGKRTLFEAGGIPCLVWLAVVVMAWNHLVLEIFWGVASVLWPQHVPALQAAMRPLPLPEGYWDALTWIIVGLFGKKVGDKWVATRSPAPAEDPAGEFARGVCGEGQEATPHGD